MHDYYPNPAKQLKKEAMRRGGPMDSLKLRFRCQQCGEQVTLSLRQKNSGQTPACKTCGPGAAFVYLGRVTDDAGSQA